MKRNEKVVFKEYIQGQPMLLPPNLGELIPEKHMVRVINEVVDKMDLSPVIQKYKGGGTSSYHPKMLIKILIYAYATKLYSGRQIAKMLRENIHYMWLSGGNQPDFRTINRFRGSKLKGDMQAVFTEVLEYLVETGYIRLENYFLDGTKIEANANKYSFVWKKSTKKYKKKLQEKVAELFEEIDAINAAEDEIYGDEDLEEMGEKNEVSSEDLKKLADRMSEKLKEKPENKQIKKVIKKLEGDFIPRLEKYEAYEKTFGKRNSFSKTDPDATFMRMKDDHMRNRSLKPGYNVQIGTEDQFIVGYSIHQTSTDSPTMIDHLKQLEQNLGKLPKTVIADAGYGSEENYVALEEKEIDAYVKYNTFYKESKKRRKLSEKEKYYARNFQYVEEEDRFLCPQKKPLIYEKTIMTKTDNGFESERRIYHCHDCEGCLVRNLCTQSKYGRSIQFSPRLTNFRKQVFEKLTSERGKALSSKRMAEPEAVFGLFKGNKSFRRFHLRGIEKVEVEWGLLAIAHNLSKIAA
jgi:transposase